MQRLMALIGIQIYAIALAVLQSVGHVRTDEAKYLLNIPYPHPPLVRWVLSLTEALPFQEMLWRVVFATLLTHAVWLVWSMSSGLQRQVRSALAVSWLLSAAVVFQAGSVMMAPLTALQGLVFVWLWMRQDFDARRIAPWVALLWVVSLFTAYQAVLFAPLVVGLLRRARIGWAGVILIAGFPVGLAVLYALSNPLSLASFVNVSTDSEGLAWSSITAALLRAWLIAGSGVLFLAGMVGMLRARAWPLLSTFVLVTLYVFITPHSYYAILFTPLLLAGSTLFVRRLPGFAWALSTLTLVGTAVLWMLFHPILTPDPTRLVMDTLSPLPGRGDILIHGSFGHDWQYESSVPVRTFTPEALREAQIVICRKKCPKFANFGEWSSAQIGDLEVYKRQ
jgi:hypothetical protein